MGDEFKPKVPLLDPDTPIQYLATELIGTFFLTLVSAGSVLSSGMLSHYPGFETLSPARAISIALTAGLCYGSLVHTGMATTALPAEAGAKYPLLPVGHFNPVVTIVFAIRRIQRQSGGFTPLKFFAWVGDPWVWMYLFMQVLGSILAALVIDACVVNAGSVGSTTTAEFATAAQALLVETIGAFAMVMVLLGALGRAADTRLQWDMQKTRAPILAAAVVAATTLLGASVSGGSGNPARSFGPAVISGQWQNHWAYWTGPLVGGLLASFLYESCVARA